MTEALPEGRYANGFNVGYNAFEFIVDFSQHFAERPESYVHSRIITSPPYAKVLLETLRESIGRYEQSYGVIPGTERTGETRGNEPTGCEGQAMPPADEGSTNMPERPEHPPHRPTPPRDEPRYGRPDPGYPPEQPKPGGYEQKPEEPPAYPPPLSKYPRPKPYPERPRDPYADPQEPTGYEPRPEKPEYSGGDEPHPRHPHPEHPGHEQSPEHTPRPPYDERPPYEKPRDPYGQTPKYDGGEKPEPGYIEEGEYGRGSDAYEPGKYVPKPDDQVKTMQRVLDEQTKKIQTLEKQRNSLKDDLAGLQQTATELNAVLTAYKEACKSLREAKAKLALYIQTKTPMVDAGIGDQRAAVDECIRSIEQWVGAWVKYAKQLEPKAKAAAQAADQAAEKAAEAQTAYDELKNSAKTLDEQLKALNALREQIEQEDDKNKIARMYFLFRELKVGMNRVRLLTPEELESELCVAWTALNEAKQAARAAKGHADSMRDAADRAKTRAADAKAKRRDLILQCIDLTCPPPPPPPGKPC